eukprot:TRINITY_DN1345_c1_g1_i4.p1 TRINITY_DN1345_c1_g1~~TRINITY_DN1345_c1_g1_i4.p1  ORF type:complete len:746 (-),score=135.79 TRINITY_DN1345_c1_g1_i4:315-2552(-)
MSSVFRARGATANETVSGRKIVRRRRYAADAAHPYLRPVSPPASENPSWISGLLAPVWTIAAGAGMLLTSVFGSDCSSSSSSSSDSDSDSDDDEYDDYSNGDSICSKENQKSNQSGMAALSTKDSPMPTRPTSNKSESKNAIEQLVLQEKFTRDECEELMKIIQSRVVDCSTVKMREDATQKGLYDRTIKNDIAFTGSWRSSSQLRGSPEAYPYSNCYLSTPSSGGSALQIRTPNLCNTAVEEAKKWLEEKKMELSPSSEHGRGLFSLSTDVLQHVKGDVTSPMDMAKSYMQSQSPWRPLSLNNIEFRTPPPIGTHHYMDEKAHSVAFYSLPSTKELKGNSLSIGSWDDREETRRVCLKSTDDTLEHHTLKQIHSSAMFENEHSQNLFVPDKGVLAITHDSSTSPAVDCNAPPNLPAELAIDGSCENGVLHPSIEKAAEVNLLVTNNMEDTTEHLTSIRSISEFEETASAEYLRHGISSSAASPSEAGHSGPVKVTTASHSIIIISEKIKDLDEAQITEESGRSHSASHIPDCILVQHEGDLSAEKLKSEPTVVPSGRDECMLSRDADAVTKCTSICSSPQISSQGGRPALIENSAQLQESPNLGKVYSLHGTILSSEDQLQSEANGVGNSGDANAFIPSQTSLSMALNAEPVSRPDEITQGSTSSDHRELAVDKQMENCELLSDASMEIPTTNENDTTVGLQSGSSKPMNVAPEIQPKKRSYTRNAARGKQKEYSRRGRRGRAK